jgi:hypothetical protein
MQSIAWRLPSLTSLLTRCRDQDSGQIFALEGYQIRASNSLPAPAPALLGSTSVVPVHVCARLLNLYVAQLIWSPISSGQRNSSIY